MSTELSTTVASQDTTVAVMDSGKFGHMQRIAKAMASSELTPKHLRNSNFDVTTANCLRVVNQAVRWELDPFAVIDETYVVHGRLGYQGKLVAAVVNARAGLAGRLRYEYKGEGMGRTVTVIGRFADEDFDRTIDLSVSQAKTDNDMWKKDPDQKLMYSGVTKWARRHCPEIMLGVMTDDDIDRIQQAAAAACTVSTLESITAQVQEAQQLLPAAEPPVEEPTPPVEEPKKKPVKPTSLLPDTISADELDAEFREEVRRKEAET
jgi:hypothetical protein